MEKRKGVEILGARNVPSPPQKPPLSGVRPGMVERSERVVGRVEMWKTAGHSTCRAGWRALALHGLQTDGQSRLSYLPLQRVDVEVIEVGRGEHTTPPVAHLLPDFAYETPEDRISPCGGLVSHSKVNRQSRAPDVS